MEWYERATGFWTWARHGRPMTRQWVRESVVERAQEFSAEYIIFGVHIGGYMAFQSDIAPPVPDMEDDVLGQLCEDGHAAGLKVLPYWMTTTGPNTIQLLEHPDWIVKNWEDKGDQVLCYSSPFGDFAEALTREALTKYPVDGMLYDQLTAGRGVQSTCYCVYCQEEFRRTYDREMPRSSHQGSYYDQPIVEDPEAQRLLRDFQIRNARHFCRRIQRAFDDIRPEAFYIQNWLFGGMAEECSEFVDGLFGERHITTDVNEVALTHRLMRAYGQKPVWGNYSYSYHHHATFRSIESTHMALMDTVASGCSATLLDLNATDDNKNRYEDMKEAMRQVRWTTDALKDSHHVKYAAILHSRSSEEFAHDDFVPSFEGTFEVLAEQQIPLEFITEKSVQSGGLDGYKVLIMPNTAYVSDATAEAITAFVHNGGGLVATYRAGMFDDRGQMRTNDWLAALAGIRRSKIVAWDMDVGYPSMDLQVYIPSVDLTPGRGYFWYFRPNDDTPIAEGIEERLLHFRAPFVSIDALDQTTIAATILDSDQKLVNMQPYNRRGLFPGEPRTPLVTLREGQGRVAYVAAPLEPERNRVECYDIDRLYRNVVVWAGGDVPIETSHVPPTVQLSLSESDDGSRLVVVMVNKTTHPLARGALQGGSIRYVVPVSNLELSIATQGKRVSSVVTASGQEVEFTQAEGRANILVSEVPVAECLTLELA